MLKIKVVGNITKDFELRTKPNSDIPYAIIRVASDRRYNDRNGERLTDFVSIKVRGRLAEACVETFKKGDRISVSGDLETIVMPDENGVMKQSGLLIKAYDVKLIPRKKPTDEPTEELSEAEMDKLLSEVDEIISDPDLSVDDTSNAAV